MRIYLIVIAASTIAFAGYMFVTCFSNIADILTSGITSAEGISKMNNVGKQI